MNKPTYNRCVRLACPAVLFVFAAPAFAKPITIHADPKLKGAWLVAEAVVVDVEAAQRAGWAGTGGKVTVQITSDPRRIYKGRHLLGQKVTLVPQRAGPAHCTSEMSKRKKNKRTVLVVADAKRVLWIAGIPSKDRSHYRVNSWCDWNACWLRIDDVRLSAAGGRPRTAVSFNTRVLASYYTANGRRFWSKVAPILSGEAKPLAQKELDVLVGRLASDSAAVRTRAHKELIRRGRYSIKELRAARAAQKDTEAQRRLDAVLAALAEYARAADVAALLAQQPREQRDWVLKQARTVPKTPENGPKKRK